MKSKGAKKKTTKNQPFVISVHGDGIDIDATFANAGGGGGGGGKGKPKGPSAIDQFFEQIMARFAANPSAAGHIKPANTPFGAMVANFGVSLTDPQLKILREALTIEQQAAFLDIMKAAGLDPGDGDAATATKEPDWDKDWGIAMRVIDNADPDVLRTIINLANSRLAPNPPAADQPS